jgi:hypothetical protein
MESLAKEIAVIFSYKSFIDEVNHANNNDINYVYSLDGSSYGHLARSLSLDPVLSFPDYESNIKQTFSIKFRDELIR